MSLQLNLAPCFIAIAPCTLHNCSNSTLHLVSLQLHLPPLHQFHLAPCFIVIAPSTIAIAPWTAYHCNLQDQMGQLEQQELAFVWHPGTIQVWLSIFIRNKSRDPTGLQTFSLSCSWSSYQCKFFLRVLASLVVSKAWQLVWDNGPAVGNWLLGCRQLFVWGRLEQVEG